MTKLAVILAGVALLVAPASADFFIPGNFNGWDNTTPMTDAGGGLWTYNIPQQAGNSWMQWVLLSQAGNWDSKVHPSGDQWGFTDAAGNNTITLDTNTYADGWYPAANRVKVASEISTDWVAVGNWQSQVGGGDWSNNNAATVMTAVGGGLYKFEATLVPGTYYYKAVCNGTWNAIGANSRNVNADNLEFTVDAANPVAQMWVDVLGGTVKVNLIPEPATLGLLLLGLLARRR